MLVAGTGSSMATFFVNLSMTSPHGTSLMTHSRLINLPPSQGPYAMMRCWGELKKAYPVHEHDQLLFKLAQDTTPATLVNMAEGWRESRGTKTILQYVRSYHTDKLLAEASEDWHYVLQLLDKVQGKNLLNLVTVDVGLDIGLFNPGLVAMLLPFTRPVAPGSSRVCLDSSLHCELIQSLLTPEGELKQVFQGMPAESTMEGLHAQRMLLKLGNAVVEAQNNDWAGPGYQHLQQYLQMWGEDLVKCCLLDRWPDQDWFQRVLTSKYNQKGARQRWEKMWGEHKRGERVLQLWEVVAQFSRMVRNCLGHAEFEEEVFLYINNGLPHLYDLNDVDIVASWPFAPSVGRIPAVIGPIASTLNACRSSGGSGGSTSGSGSGGTGSSSSSSSGTSDGSGSSTIGSGSRSGSAVPTLTARRWPGPLQRRDLRGVKIGMPLRQFRGSGLQDEVDGA